MTLANTGDREISVIDGLALEARALRTSIELNMWQFARVLAEARELVPRGEWKAWLEENAGISERSAQQAIQTFRRFGENPKLQEIGKANLFKMLALPAGTEDEFIEKHDVQHMSAREVERAVKEAIEQEREKTREAERAAREAAEKEREKAREGMEAMADDKARELARQKERYERELGELNDRLAESQSAAEELRRMAEEAESRARDATRAAIESAKDVAAQSNQMAQDAERLRRELDEKDQMIAEMQAEYDAVQAEYLNLQSAVAKGDAERAPADQLTLDAFAGAVRSFIGTVARMPHMRMAFAGMDGETREEYGLLLETVEKWVRDSRTALETTGAEGVVI